MHGYPALKGGLEAKIETLMPEDKAWMPEEEAWMPEEEAWMPRTEESGKLRRVPAGNA